MKVTLLSFHSLQPHNILLASKENSAPIKIADFGVAVEIGEEGYVTSGERNWAVYVHFKSFVIKINIFPEDH